MSKIWGEGHRVHTAAGVQESPSFGSGDDVKLRALFPDNPVWEGSEDNIRHIDINQAKALYDVMTAYYAENEVSPELYQTGNFVGSFAVTSDLESLFDDLIKFFEDKIGFKASEPIATAITTKQQKREQQRAEAAANYREETRLFFEKLGTLGPVAEGEAREKIQAKLLEYKGRLERDNLPPPLAFQVRHKYRDATYKIFVGEYTLSTKHGVRLVDLAMMQIDARGGNFDAMEFFSACAVIAVYAGTPLPGTEVVELAKS